MSNDTKEKEEEEIKTISTGYTTEEIQMILNAARNLHVRQPNDLLDKLPSHDSNFLNAPVEGSMSFLEHKPYLEDSALADEYNRWTKEHYFYFEVNGQPLRVKLGFSADRDIKINETRMHSGFDTSSDSAVKHLYFQGDAGATIDCTILIRPDDLYVGEEVGSEILYNNPPIYLYDVLSDWSKSFELCKIVSMSPIVENGYYRINKFNPTQVYEDLIVVDVGFVEDTYTYRSRLTTYQTDRLNKRIETKGNRVIQDAMVNGYTDTLASSLSGCDELRKVCTCIDSKKNSCTVTYKYCTLVLQKALQRVSLYLDGRLDGLFCYVTHNAVIQFQKRFQGELSVNGIADKKTIKKLCDVLEEQHKAGAA